MLKKSHCHYYNLKNIFKIAKMFMYIFCAVCGVYMYILYVFFLE